MCETFFPLATVFVVGLGETLWLSRERTANRALGRVAILSVAGGKKKPDLLSKVGLSGELILPGSVVGGQDLNLVMSDARFPVVRRRMQGTHFRLGKPWSLERS